LVLKLFTFAESARAWWNAVPTALDLSQLLWFMCSVSCVFVTAL